MNKIMFKICLYGIKDFIKSKWGIVYFLSIFLITEGMFRFSGESIKAITGLMSVSIFLVPLISVIFGALYYYNSKDFIELLLTQPVKRTTVYTGLFCGLTFSLSICYLLGLSIPVLFRLSILNENSMLLFLLLVSGVLLTFSFVALAFWISLSNEDKGKGLGFALLTWLVLAIMYDGIVLFVVFLFNNYPLEQPLIVLMFLNPIDLARMMLLLHIDLAALMGYTGAVFERFFGNPAAELLAIISLVTWVIAPFYIGLRKFKKNDF